MERRLTTILAADVVGYRRLFREDEAGSLAPLKAHRAKPAERSRIWGLICLQAN